MNKKTRIMCLVFFVLILCLSGFNYNQAYAATDTLTPVADTGEDTTGTTATTYSAATELSVGFSGGGRSQICT